MNDKHFVITIERQYGSGGRLTGKRLAEELGIHFYDEEILKMTSETSAIGEQYFRLADERAGNNMLYRIVTSMKPELTEPDKDGPNITSPENLFRFQSSVIRRLAASETCIIVGRCGNYVLQDQMDNLVRIFVYADTVTRIRRVMRCVRQVIARQLSGSWKFNSRMWLCVMSFFPMETGSIWC